MTDQSAAVATHYGAAGLLERVLDAISASGGNPDQLTADDLKAVDEFHIRGHQATLELAQLAGVQPGWRVIDVGCGLGGPARLLAQRFDVDVVGVDITPEFCRTATALVERTGLAGRVEIKEGDALDLPVADATFDCAWSQHASMNIADKAGFYREMRRVLRPDGCLAIYDIAAGAGGDVVFPVPWATEPSISHLADVDSMRATITEAGFAIDHWNDDSGPALEWFRAVAATMAERQAPPPLGLHLLLGAAAPAMFQHQVQNLEEDRIRLVQVVAHAT